MSMPGWLQNFLQRLKKIAFILFISHLAYIIILKWVDPPITVTQLVSLMQGHGLKRDYVNYNEMSSNIKLAVMASEDQLFPLHNGFDWKSIEKAMKNNSKTKVRRIKGGSTISQQVAKNVFLWQDRTWVRKGLEVYFTFMIELIWGKERILEMYLNVAEMGKGVFGVEAAAQNYFKKPAKKLSGRESAMIAACLPSPKKYKVNPPSPYITKRYPWVMGQMNYLRTIDQIALLVDPPKARL
jgi:monofunctional glycosyltransferase